MGSVWVLFLLSAHARPIYLTYFYRQSINRLYHGYNYSYLMLTDFIGSSYMIDIFTEKKTI